MFIHESITEYQDYQQRTILGENVVFKLVGLSCKTLNKMTMLYLDKKENDNIWILFKLRKNIILKIHEMKHVKEHY